MWQKITPLIILALFIIATIVIIEGMQEAATLAHP